MKSHVPGQAPWMLGLKNTASCRTWNPLVGNVSAKNVGQQFGRTGCSVVTIWTLVGFIMHFFLVAFQTGRTGERRRLAALDATLEHLGYMTNQHL